MMKRFTAVMALLAIVCAASVAAADEEERRMRPSGARDHEGGFLMRLSIGAGGGGTELEDQVLPADISGAIGKLNIAIGGVVTPNLAIHGTIFSWTASDPEVKIANLSGELEGDVTMSAIGAPASQARSISPPETTSMPAPSERSSRHRCRLGLALTA